MNPSSAKTSLNQVPALHKFTASLGLSTFDFGAGKEGKIDEFYKTRKLLYLPYDPFNRSEEANVMAWRCLEYGGMECVTCANVLNVVEPQYLDSTLFNLAAATRQTSKGVCFVSVYHNSRLPKNRKVGDHFQRNEPIGWYVPHLSRVFSSVDKLGQFLVCKV